MRRKRWRRWHENQGLKMEEVLRTSRGFWEGKYGGGRGPVRSLSGDNLHLLLRNERR
jgi:hypothetical protein